MVAFGFGVASYAMTRPGFAAFIEREAQTTIAADVSAGLIFFTVFGFSFLIWATIPLSTGSSRQFDPGNLLMYPISLKKLFAIDFISELVTLPSIFALPSLVAIGIGAGLGTGMLARAILVSLLAAAFGLALTKWLSVATGSLTRRKRTRGETLIAIIGAVLGLGGAALGQVAPILFRHAEYIRFLRWTPPGAAAFAMSGGLTGNVLGYLAAITGLTGYVVVLVVAAYWIARRAALGLEGGKRSEAKLQKAELSAYTGWELPLASAAVGAIVEKEVRYITRNAQVRMMALMPLLLIVIRLANVSRLDSARSEGLTVISSEFETYAQQWMAAGGVLYVFLILSGLSCNLFAFEEGGMRTLILSPIDRRKILVGKNIAAALLAFILSAALLLVNQLVFGDLMGHAILFAALSFVIFAALMSVMGNWLSIRFPKRMKFGKRMNVSGVVGILLIPMIMLLALPSLAATAAGYLSQSLLIEYATLSLLAALAVGLYALLIGSEGELLQRREVDLLEAIKEPPDE